MAQLPNLVLVTVDCLRADHVGWMGYSRPTTPFLDSLATGSVTFENAIVGGAPTFYSLPSLLASRSPLALGRDVVGLAPGEPSLVSVLKQAGYRTAAFNAGNPYLSARFGYAQGFDHFEDFLQTDALAEQTEGSKPARTPWNERVGRVARQLKLGDLYDELYFQYMIRLRNRGPVSFDLLRRFPAADILVGRAKQWLESSTAPFFLWLHCMDPHGPYYPAVEALRVMGDEKLGPAHARYVNHYWNRRELNAARLCKYRDTIVRLYDAGIRWVDTQMARLVHSLENAGLWENCVFVFTADHGEEFLDHASRFHSQWTAKEELIKVPLLIRVPNQSIAGSSKGVFSQIDLAPTLLEALGVAIPLGFHGQSFWGRIAGGQAWNHSAVVDCTEAINPNRSSDRLKPRVLCVRDERYKLIIRFGSHAEEVYDLANDPAEMSALPIGVESAARARLFRHAQEYLRRTPVDSLDLRLRAKLRDLRAELLSSSET
jgi:arylsulfatase A-like enzyme